LGHPVDSVILETKTNTASKCNSITITSTKTKTISNTKTIYILKQILENYIKTKTKTNLILKQI